MEHRADSVLVAFWAEVGNRHHERIPELLHFRHIHFTDVGGVRFRHKAPSRGHGDGGRSRKRLCGGSGWKRLTNCDIKTGYAKCAEMATNQTHDLSCVKETMPPLPKKVCPYCRRMFSNKGVYSHKKYHCKHNPNKIQKTYVSQKCSMCSKHIHPKAMPAHLYTQHHVPFATQIKQTQKKIKNARRVSSASQKSTTDARKAKRIEIARKMSLSRLAP